MYQENVLSHEAR